MVSAYFKFKRVSEYFKYLSSRKLRTSIFVLTFDDVVNDSNIEIAEYLYDQNISATFFVPAKLTEREILRGLVKMNHELGGHGYTHSNEEREEDYLIAKQCMSILKKYDKNVISWRFPWLSYTKKSVKNVLEAGFRIDSSKGCFYPIQNFYKIDGLVELPFLRLPPKWQMDINVEYNKIFDYVLRMSKLKGITVLPFHTKYQYSHYKEFRRLIEELIEKEIEFKNLREAYFYLENVEDD